MKLKIKTLINQCIKNETYYIILVNKKIVFSICKAWTKRVICYLKTR